MIGQKSSMGEIVEFPLINLVQHFMVWIVDLWMMMFEETIKGEFFERFDSYTGYNIPIRFGYEGRDLSYDFD